jgi:hypothetical protein
MYTLQAQCIFGNDDFGRRGMRFVIELDACVLHTSGDGESTTQKGVRVEEMSMWVDAEGEAHSDFAVYYNEEDWDADEEGHIYTDSGFLAGVRDIVKAALKQLDEHNEHELLVADIDYTEHGMQDNGRVSMDAIALTDYLFLQAC